MRFKILLLTAIVISSVTIPPASAYETVVVQGTVTTDVLSTSELVGVGGTLRVVCRDQIFNLNWQGGSYSCSIPVGLETLISFELQLSHPSTSTVSDNWTYQWEWRTPLKPSQGQSIQLQTTLPRLKATKFRAIDSTGNAIEKVAFRFSPEVAPKQTIDNLALTSFLSGGVGYGTMWSSPMNLYYYGDYASLTLNADKGSWASGSINLASSNEGLACIDTGTGPYKSANPKCSPTRIDEQLALTQAQNAERQGLIEDTRRLLASLDDAKTKYGIFAAGLERHRELLNGMLTEALKGGPIAGPSVSALTAGLNREIAQAKMDFEMQKSARVGKPCNKQFISKIVKVGTSQLRCLLKKGAKGSVWVKIS